MEKKKTTEIAVEAFAYAKKELLEVARDNRDSPTKSGAFGMEGDDPLPSINREQDLLRLVVLVHEREKSTEYLVDILKMANSLPELLLLLDTTFKLVQRATVVKIEKEDDDDR